MSSKSLEIIYDGWFIGNIERFFNDISSSRANSIIDKLAKIVKVKLSRVSYKSETRYRFLRTVFVCATLTLTIGSLLHF